MTDIDGISKLIGLAQLTKDGVTDIVKRVFGPIADKAGDALAQRFFGDRSERVLTVMADSVQLSRDAGYEPQAVPGRLLWPILEACAREEDETLQQKWAALLANAASPGASNKVLPAYVEILRQLIPVQAAILQWIYDQKTQSLSGHWPDFHRPKIEEEFRLSHSDYALLISDLHRLQVIEGRRKDVVSPVTTTINFEDAMEQVVQTLNARAHYDMIAITSLGIHFMEACTPPARVGSGS